MAYPLATERVWIEKAKYHDAEKDYFEHLSKLLKGSNNNNNNKIELQKQQDHEEEQKDQIMQSTKSKKIKKDKNKKIKLQQSSTEELSSSQNNELLSSKNENENSMSVVSAAVKEQQLCIENSSSSNITATSAAAAVATNMNSNNINTTDDDSKQKKKKKKKNKSTEHKLNENLNNDGKSQLNDNGTGTAVSSINSNVINNTESLNQDEIIDPNNKKNEIKQRPTNLKNSKGSSVGTNQNTLVSEIAKARQHIKNSLEKMDGIAALAASPGTSPGSDVLERFTTLEKENATFKGLIEQLRKSQIECEKRINSLETKLESLTLSVQQQLQSKKPIDCVATTSKSTTKKVVDDDDDGVDLFESDSEEENAEAAKVREQRLAEYAAKKSKKPTLIAKSNVILDVKPWDDETDLEQMEKEIRKITTDGLLWGSSKLVPVAFGIKKLTISCVVEDEKVSIDWLTEEIEKLEDYVQSVDVAAFNKI